MPMGMCMDTCIGPVMFPCTAVRGDSTAAGYEYITKGSSSAASCRRGRRALHEPPIVCTASLQVLSAHSEFSFVSHSQIIRVSFFICLFFPFGDINFSFRISEKGFSVLSLAALCFQMSTEKLMEFSHVDKGAADSLLPSLTNNACFKKHYLPLSGN